MCWWGAGEGEQVMRCADDGLEEKQREEEESESTD